MKEKKYINLMILLLILGFCGCKKHNVDLEGTAEMSISLTERQMNILTEKGLPLNYDELTSMQKEAIVAIEEILCYTEDKYGESFEYISYTNDDLVGHEELAAIPSGGDKDSDLFVITRKKIGDEYVYSDGYANVVASPVFNEYIQDFIFAQIGYKNAKSFSDVLEISNGKYPVETKDIPGNVKGSICVFVDGESVDQEQFMQLVNDFREWAREQKLDVVAQFILTKEDVLLYLTAYNYMEYLNPDFYLQREFVTE